MPVDKSGQYHLNPQNARMHDRAPSLKAAVPHAPKPPGVKEPEPHGAPAVHHMEFHRHPEGGGKLKSISHHEDGSQSEADHENVHDAADHLAESMGDEQGEGMGGGEMGDASPMGMEPQQ